MTSKQLRALSVIGLLALSCGVARAGEKQAEINPRIIIDSYTLFRCHFEANGCFVKREDGSWWPRKPEKGKDLPAGWQQPDFDDSNWPAMPGPFFPGGRYGRYGFNFRTGISQSLSTICLRAGFEVTDISKAGELRMDLDFRGGAVVYINGKEIKRSHLPEGKLEGHTMAEAYPKEVYVKPDGKIIRNGWKEPDKFKDRVEKRVRRIRGLLIPPKLLRKGCNVLAVRLQSAPHHQVTLVKGRKGFRFYGFRSGNQKYASWLTVGMPKISLQATGDGVRSSLVRPKGFQVYNQSALSVVYDTDYALPGTRLTPLHISAARNGSFAAQLVISRDKPIEGLKASIGALSSGGDKGVIPASALRLRYPQPTGPAPDGYKRLPGGSKRSRTSVNVSDALFEAPPGIVPVRTKRRSGKRPFVFGAIQPIWLTVDVPADTAPGTYTGALRVEAKGLKAVEVPVHVAVSTWSVPAPHQWRTFVDLVQSPESVALRYDVPLWSDAHFVLLEESLKRLGSIGNKTVYLSLIAKTDFGNSGTMLRWTKQADGSLKPDYTVVDRYLALVKKHLVEPMVVCLYVWDRPFGGGYFGKEGKYKPTEVSGFDPKTATSSLVKAPAYDQEGAKAFWKPAADGMRERIEKLGWGEALMLGAGDDFIPSKTVCRLWKELLPKAGWVSYSHDIFSSYHGIAAVGYATTVWKPKWAPPPSKGRLRGWNRKNLVCHFDRDSWRKPAQSQLFQLSYLASDRNITGAQRGFGRISADFWKVLKGSHGRSYSISARYPDSSKGQLQIRMVPYLSPGPKGAISTVRLEMMREGLMECEARIIIESALLDKAACAKLSDAKTKAYQELVDEKTNWTRAGGNHIGALKYIGSDWRGRRTRLFDAAAEVNRLLGKAEKTGNLE
jgi:Glycoside hydrolase 123, catalytic domain/Glycoside hydrolase 123 N-terminal domain